MPALTASVYRIPSLTQDILNDSLDAYVPDNVYEETIKPLYDELIAKGINPLTKFDPEKHLLFTDDYFEKTKRLTLKDLKYEKTHQEPITEVGVSEPFPLFTDEAIDIMRLELFAKDAFQFGSRISEHSNTGDLDIYSRGSAKKYQPFTYAAWSHPKTLEIISKMAKVELVHMVDYEIGHTNVSIKTAQTEFIPDSEPQDVELEEDPEKIQASVTWHYDSPQYVCVLMLSDTSKMIGGETALLMGNGKVTKAAGPKRGWATILQGRLLKHIASKPKGAFTERIASVASLRPKDPMMDNCFMTTVKPSTLKGSRYNDFYNEWMNYRLDVLSARIDVLKKQLNEKYEKGEYFDQFETVDFIQKKLIEYAEHTYQEFEAVDDGLIPKPASYNVVKAQWDNESNYLNTANELK